MTLVIVNGALGSEVREFRLGVHKPRSSAIKQFKYVFIFACCLKIILWRVKGYWTGSNMCFVTRITQT